MSDDGKKRNVVTVRLDRSEFYDLQSEADRLGLNNSNFIRHAIKHTIRNPSGLSQNNQSAFNPDGEFGEYLATAMALMIITGAHATDGLDAKVKEMTLDIMKSLGVA